MYYLLGDSQTTQEYTLSRAYIYISSLVLAKSWNPFNKSSLRQTYSFNSQHCPKYLTRSDLYWN